MLRFTIYTPTYNRAHTLQRVYESLKNQTYTDFIWLIVDDGSNDNTKNLVEKWKNEAKINIEYLYKPNGGKHTAMNLAHQSIITKYTIGLDSDDILLPEAVETFNYHWKLIEDQGKENEFAEIRAFSCYAGVGGIIGGNLDMFNEGLDYIDSTWHEWYLKKKYGHEMIMALNTNKLRECVNISNYSWHSDKIKFIGESVFWSAIGRKYRTRYIKHIALRVYYNDKEESLLRPITKNIDRFYQHMVTAMYFVNENFRYFWYNPKKFISNIFIFLISGLILQEPLRKQLNVITNNTFYVLSLLFYPMAFLAFLYLKYIKKIANS
jgi:glycosyltransferase involved in cell wall biosynthesis